MRFASLVFSRLGLQANEGGSRRRESKINVVKDGVLPKMPQECLIFGDFRNA